jgi:hypothetical protein
MLDRRAEILEPFDKEALAEERHHLDLHLQG